MMRPLVLASALMVAAQPAVPGPSSEPVLDLVRRFDALASDTELWPRFRPREIPLAIYDGSRTYLVRHSSPPAGFEPHDEGAPDVRVLEGRHPAVVANSSVEIGDILTATLVMDGRAADTGRLAATALHEAFHVYQRLNHPGWTANEASLFTFPVDDAGLLALRRLETSALRRALAASAPGESGCWAAQSLDFRHRRYEELDPEFAAYERGTELNEGLARYMELRALGEDDLELPEAGFAAADVRRRGYAVGAALALLLDHLAAGWRESLERNDDRYLDGLLAATLDVDAGEAASRCGFTPAEVADATQVAEADSEALLADRRTKRARFDDREGWRLEVVAAAGEPLWPGGFDPLNLERIEGGILHTRLLRLHNDAGRLEFIADDAVDANALTEAAGEHPLFNGVRRVTLTGLAEPAVERSNGSVAVRVPGLVADFQEARATLEGTRWTIALAPTQP